LKVYNAYFSGTITELQRNRITRQIGHSAKVANETYVKKNYQREAVICSKTMNRIFNDEKVFHFL
jgi:hypothetical protein